MTIYFRTTQTLANYDLDDEGEDTEYPDLQAVLKNP
jgi:hypothetical protein